MATEQFFDAEGRLDVEITRFEGGGYARIDFDQADVGPWRANTLTYDSSGRLLEDFVVFDTGAYTAVWFDAASTQSWTVRSARYDAVPRLEEFSTVFDDGRITRETFDAAAIQPWSVRTTDYDAAGRLETASTLYDDLRVGREAYDVRDAFAWAETRSYTSTTFRPGMSEPSVSGSLDIIFDDGSRTQATEAATGTSSRSATTSWYDASGRLDMQFDLRFGEGVGTAVLQFDFDLQDEFSWAATLSYVYPNGANWAITYDTGASVQTSWDGDLSHSSRDPLGRPTLSSVERADGSSSRTEYDAAGLAPWSEITVTHDAQRRQTSYYARFDDGARDWSYYDVNDVQPWSAASSHRNAGSNRVDWTALLDDGTVVTGFDLV